MANELKYKIQEAFAEVYTITDLAKLYAEILVECDRQLAFMEEQIKKEVINNGE